MIKLSEKGVFLASNNEIIAEEHFTGEIKKEEAKKGTCNLKYDEYIYSMFQPISIFHHHTPRVICTRKVNIVSTAPTNHQDLISL